MENKRYGRWTVLAEDGRRLVCRCDCGTVRKVIRSDLWRGRSTGCECRRRVTMAAARLAAVVTHGMEDTPEYRTWVDMRRRCHQPNRPDYHRYGGRGISVCERWRHDFAAFYADLGSRPEGHTLDRIDNDGDYEPGNCRWAPRKVQARNTRTNRFLKIGDVRMTVVEAGETFGLSPVTIISRLSRGWTAEDAVSRPVRPGGKKRLR